METLLKKLDSKTNNNMVIFNMPPEFEPVERNLNKEIHIYKSNTAIKTEFVLIFIKTKAELEHFTLHNMSYLLSFCDDLIWFAYPKENSEKYGNKSNISRDEGWEPLLDLGYKGVRMVSIDSDWTAFRVRKEEYILKQGKTRGEA